MDEDGVVIPTPQKPQPADDDGLPVPGLPVEPQESEPDSQAEEEEERVFDISPDLEISEEKSGSAPVERLQAAPTASNDPAAPKIAPANPQPKRIGEAYGIMAEKQARATVVQNRQNLQEAVSTMIPGNLRADMTSKAARPLTSTAKPAASTVEPLNARPSPSSITKPPAPTISTPTERQSPSKPSVPRQPTSTSLPTMPIPIKQQPSSTPSIPLPVKAPRQSMPPTPSATIKDSSPSIPPIATALKWPVSSSKTPEPTPTASPAAPVDQRFPAYASTPIKQQMTTPDSMPKPPKASYDPNVKPLRTYESDVADVLSHRNISQASMAIAENMKQGGQDKTGSVPEAPTANIPTANVADAIKETAEPPSHAGRKLFLVLFSLILIAAGVFGGYYLYQQSPLAAPASQPAAPQQPQSVVKAETQTVIAIDGLSGSAITSKVRTEMVKPQAPGSIKEIILTETQDGTLVRASPASVLTTMGIPAPDMIVRTLQPQWMLGVYADASGDNSLFVVVETDFFQNAFAGMLQWEATMPQDLQPYLYAQATSSIIIRGQFEDRIVKNVDVREFTAPDGQTPFLYSFIDSSKLVATGNEATLSEIISRLEQQAFMR